MHKRAECYPFAGFFLGILNLCIFSLTKCERIATENICQKFYSFEIKENQNYILNFDLSLSSFRINTKGIFFFLFLKV